MQVKNSVKVPEKSNIRDLATAVIGKHNIKPTVQLYMRLAFLVRHSSLSILLVY
jgi:hypothetical protein